MQTNAEDKIKQDLLVEIQVLEQNYQVIKGFIMGKECEVAVLGESVKSFKDSLSRASAYVLALYNLKGQRVNIPWESLFNSLDYALATLTTAPRKAEVQAVLAMADPQMGQVLSYFSALKDSIR
jgi:hypothetical protein